MVSDREVAWAEEDAIYWDRRGRHEEQREREMALAKALKESKNQRMKDKFYIDPNPHYDNKVVEKVIHALETGEDLK